jgi:hypothetical protein
MGQAAIADIAFRSNRGASHSIAARAAGALHGLPETTEDLEVQSSGAHNVAVAMAPNVMEELQRDPNPVMRITERSVVVMEPGPNRGTRRSETPAAMERKRANHHLYVFR